jgi:hypothetical protein
VGDVLSGGRGDDETNAVSTRTRRGGDGDPATRAEGSTGRGGQLWPGVAAVAASVFLRKSTVGGVSCGGPKIFTG